MAPIHDRMPAILAPDGLAEWLDARSPDAACLKRMLAPAPADTLIAQPVSTLVNNVGNDSPSCWHLRPTRPTGKARRVRYSESGNRNRKRARPHQRADNQERPAPGSA